MTKVLNAVGIILEDFIPLYINSSSRSVIKGDHSVIGSYHVTLGGERRAVKNVSNENSFIRRRVQTEVEVTIQVSSV